MKDILIVEDGKLERERLENLFKEKGYSTTACEGVADAERQVGIDQFRLAILDIGLGDRSGSFLFDTLKRSGKVNFLIIFTGNPSVHLKQRFLSEGAVDYIVKGSPQAHSDALVQRIAEIIGESQSGSTEGIDLMEFLAKYIPATSRNLFLDFEENCPECRNCHAREYVVSFAQKPQLPPEVIGIVVCAKCGNELDPEVS